MSIGITRKTNSPASTLKQKAADNKVGNASNKAAKTSAASPRGSGVTADSISLTVSASQLQELESRILSMPVVDASIVDAVHNQLTSGSYKVNDKTAADKLLEQEKKFAGGD